jgi:hypothetical protein
MGRPGARGSPFVWANLGVISFDRKNSLSDLKQYSADVNVQTMDVNVGHQARGYPPTHPENKGLTAPLWVSSSKQRWLQAKSCKQTGYALPPRTGVPFIAIEIPRPRDGLGISPAGSDARKTAQIVKERSAHLSRPGAGRDTNP